MRVICSITEGPRTMLRPMSRLVVTTVLLLGCSGTSEPAHVPETSPTTEPTAAETTTAPTSTATPPAGNHSRELSVADCVALATKYESLTRSDEMAKLPDGLTAEQIQISDSQIARGAEALSDRWEEGCVKSLVGKEHPEQNLHCAMASKTVGAFDVCLNGPADPAPQDTPKK